MTHYLTCLLLILSLTIAAILGLNDLTYAQQRRRDRQPSPPPAARRPARAQARHGKPRFDSAATSTQARRGSLDGVRRDGIHNASRH